MGPASCGPSGFRLLSVELDFTQVDFAFLGVGGDGVVRGGGI